MLSNYHTLRYVVSTIASGLVGKAIGELFSQEKGEAVLTSPGAGNALVFSCRNDTNTLYLQPGFVRARTNSANILGSATGATISAVEIVGADRTVRFGLPDGSLFAQFHGPKANLLLVNREGKIEDSFKNSRKLIGTIFAAPDPHPPDYSLGRLEQAIRLHPGETGQSLKKLYPTLGSTLVAEVLCRGGLEPTTRVEKLGADGIRVLCDSFRAVVADLAHPRPRFYLSAVSGDPEIFSLIPLQQFNDRPVKVFDDVSEAIRMFIFTRRSVERRQDEQKLIVTAIEKSVERASRAVAAMQHDLQHSTRADDYQRVGTLLLAHLQDIPAGSSSWTAHDGSGTREVKLDPQRTVAQNAQRYFDKAKQNRSMRVQAEQRLSGLQERITRGRRLLAALEQINSRDELRTLMKEHSDDLHTFGISDKGKKEELPPFRVFTVDGGFQVLAGKSSANNDMLTMKFAKQNDLWFHARGSSGSHVVLRVGSAAGEPSRKAKQQAAAIAAYYSKMRNAKNVPVVMTERKYVHKPRGAPAGTVTLDRETVVYADPMLPKEV
jgi:predicted ribosome quality control (RQC) complex YloA/Tae2 family protein